MSKFGFAVRVVIVLVCMALVALCIFTEHKALFLLPVTGLVCTLFSFPTGGTGVPGGKCRSNPYGQKQQ